MNKVESPKKSELNILDNLINESEHYTSLDAIERNLELGKDLSQFPVQPLYLLCKAMSEDRMGARLIKFTPEQRKLFLDIDLWFKDGLDLDNFIFWVKSYAKCPDDKIRLEFAKSSSFALYLKAKFNIWTFDIEDPQYPDHDNYFLTEDNLLLIEFCQDTQDYEEIRSFVKDLYTHMGVESAYAHILKIVTDSFSYIQEEEYQLKKARLEEIGHIDYYSALELDVPFANIDLLESFILKKRTITPEIDLVAKNQCLHKSTLTAYKGHLGDFSEELGKLQSIKRLEYLRFNFLRLVNAGLTLDNALKEGSIAMTRMGQKVRFLTLLGFNYIRERQFTHGKIGLQEGENLLDRFDFWDFYKTGNTLIRTLQKKIKNALEKSSFNIEGHNEGFLGGYWSNFLDNSFIVPVKFTEVSETPKEIVHIEQYAKWQQAVDTFIAFLPFVERFYETFNNLKETGRLQDDFYLNYNVADIDIEAIVLSSLANYMIGNLGPKSKNKMGLTTDEFLKWASSMVGNDGKIRDKKGLTKEMLKFMQEYGLDQINGFSSYLMGLVLIHLEGYDYSSLRLEDFKHVGGPVILNE